MDREFFDVLFERVESGYVGLCKHPKKGTRFVPVHEVAEAVNGDFYFSVGVFESPPLTGRGTEADVSLLPCLWIDIDFADKTDAKKDYPTEEQARAALDQMPAKATIVVNSGGGLHAYWVLVEPMLLTSFGAFDRLAIGAAAGFPCSACPCRDHCPTRSMAATASPMCRRRVVAPSARPGQCHRNRLRLDRRQGVQRFDSVLDA